MSTNKATVFPELRDTFGVLTTREQKIIFDIVKQWADSLTTELTSQIIQEQARESIRVARVDDTANVPNPQAGDIRFNISTSSSMISSSVSISSVGVWLLDCCCFF